MPPLQRKYIDLIRSVSSMWVNWDAPIEIRVGSYGTIDKETGDLIVEGNIYDSDFQTELDDDIKLMLANHPPLEGPVDDDFILATRGAKRKDLNTDNEVNIPGISNAVIKTQWAFEPGIRAAILIMRRPRVVYIPPNVVLEPLYRVDKLTDKWLVTNVHVCPAYTMYLSDTSGDKVTLALGTEVDAAAGTASSDGSSTWYVDAQSGLLRKAVESTGSYSFTPLYSLKRPIKRGWRFWRDASTPVPSGDILWHDASPPWDPLDEDGEEDPLDSPV